MPSLLLPRSPRNIGSKSIGFLCRRDQRAWRPDRSRQLLGIAPNTLTFHLDRLRHAGLVSVARQGRSLVYAARYETMNNLLGYLTENCCGGRPELCEPVACTPTKSPRKRKETAR